MASTFRGNPHSVKQWQLEGIGLQAGETEMSIKECSKLDQSVSNQTRFSAWTPMASKSFNKQLFHERVNLIGHWFDLWTDKQRKQFLHSILIRSSKAQLKFVRGWFTEEVPVAKLDFTTVLPRFVSLYILSFLNPRDLCSAAQVSWHWKFLSEQDCLWMPKCSKFGWFLPYTPPENEYGAWKRHYITCACSLDYLTPREATETYGTLNEPMEGNEEHKEKLREKWLRKMLRERLALHKQELFKSRPPWMSGAWKSALLNSKLKLNQSNSLSDQAALQAALWLIKDQVDIADKTLSGQLMDENNQSLSFRLNQEKRTVANSVKSFPKRQTVAGSHSLLTRQCHSLHHEFAQTGCSSKPYLLLISSNIPAYEVVLDSVKPGVIPVVYDFCGMTPESLLFYVEKALKGLMAQSIGLVTCGDSQQIRLLENCQINSQNILKPGIREFWEKLGSCVESEKNGGHIDVFVPLAASESGMEILDRLAQLTGVMFCSPTGLITGSYQHILSEWLSGSRRNVSPPSLYFNEVKLQGWCRLASIMEEALQMVRKQLKLYIGEAQRKVSGRIIGQFMFDTMTMARFQNNQKLSEALTDGLVELSKGKFDNPLEFMSVFLLKRCSKNEEFGSQARLTNGNDEGTLTLLKEEDTSSGETTFDQDSLPPCKNELMFPHPTRLENKLLADIGDRRTRFAGELLRSEREYVQILEVIRDVYVVPLKAALSSNRAILSISNVQIIFSDVLNILKINKHFLHELNERFNEWGPAQCLGDVFMKFGSQLKSYTNFFNNYSVILKTIDKSREANPTFRAFLKRHDNTVPTKMMSLQELLLFPSSRFEEYVNLLYAFRLHTVSEHPDRKDLTTAIGQMKKYQDYIGQLKTSFEKESEMPTIQKSIMGCPNLVEANRHLIRVQDVALLNCSNEDVMPSLRIYEQISDLSFFLFNDALLITSLHVSFAPFKRAAKTSYQFMASVSLPHLIVEDIPDTKYVKNAFVLQGPKRQWICSTVSEEEKFTWLSICQSAISASIEKK
ncbi:epithelial cell-transforming sequence 2 oncogene-like [Spea bombifrons]|uniref:epithelial cell-transforming sequence 2 oncogene-like n=1 Tax=Spea bombifrons TaxID=233779 RepID=UPI002349D88B|nr:epithelial cell-transforming sequence 2 oncogene-like [Spea bombifrons]